MTLWVIWSLLVSALIALAATVVDRAAVLAGAARRFVWLGAMICATLVPIAAAVWRSRPPPAQLAVTAPPRVQPPPKGMSLVATRPATTPQTTLPIAPAPRARAWDRALPRIQEIVRAVDRWIVPAWITASAALMIIFGGAMLRVRRQLARWHETELGGSRTLVAPDAGPAVIGFIRPRIVIPTWVLALDQPARALLIRHEVEHIEAGDPRLLLAAGFLVTAFPWNAALWWMLGRLRLSIEIDCDARVVGAVGSAHDYGMLLLAVGERHTRSLPFAAALTESRPDLEWRIAAMTTVRPYRPVIAAMLCAGVALLAIVVVAKAPRPAAVGVARAAGSLPGVGNGVTYTIHGTGGWKEVTYTGGPPTQMVPDNWTAKVIWANGRGRIDVTDGVLLARPGDYILFDSTEFILVRPIAGASEPTGFIGASVSNAMFSMFKAVVAGAATQRFDSSTGSIATLAIGEVVAGEPTRHVELHAQSWGRDSQGAQSGATDAREYWVADPNAVPPNPFMRCLALACDGTLLAGIKDAGTQSFEDGRSERWHELVAQLPPGLILQTSNVHEAESSRGMTVVSDFPKRQMIAIDGIRRATVDPSKLVLPSGMTEIVSLRADLAKRFPNDPRFSGADDGAKWRVLPAGK